MYQTIYFHPNPNADTIGGPVVLRPSARDSADSYYRMNNVTFDSSLEPGTAIVGGTIIYGVTFVHETDVGGHPVGPAAYGFDSLGRCVYFHV